MRPKHELQSPHRSSSQLGDIDNKNTEEEFDDQNKTENCGQHIFEFVHGPSCVTLFSGRSIELLYFAVVTEKGVADKKLKDCYNHTINTGETFFRGNYIKLVRLRNPSIKQFPPDEINDTSVDINKDLQININVYNGLVNKAPF